MRRLLVLLTFIALAAGCASDPTAGYAVGGVFPDHIRTVSVPIAQNDSYIRDIEIDLTDALQKEIIARTPYAVTTTGRADSILVVRITEVEMDQISKSRVSGLGEEVVVRMTIDFEWRDLTADRSIVVRKSFTGQSLFVPSTPTGERVEIGRFAVAQLLARDIVDTMQSSW